MKPDRWLLAFLCFVLVVMAAAAAVTIRRPLHGDEEHFVPTIDQFAADPSLNTLRHYGEMSTPLPFVLYALWGRLVGVDLRSLRVFSILVALATYILFFAAARGAFQDSRLAALIGALLLANPYMAGLSVFVYTDMVAMFFMILALLAFQRRSAPGFACCAAGAVLCRQYLVFLPAAVIVHSLLRLIRSRDAQGLGMLLAGIGACLPLAALAIFWGGLSPDNQLRVFYAGETLRFHVPALILYVILSFVYLVPVLIFRIREVYGRTVVLIGSLVAGMLYWVFPVRASPSAIAAGVDTVGFLHIALRRLAHGSRLQDVLFFILFVLGIPVAFAVIRDGVVRFKRRESDFLLLLDLLFVFFLLIMPFSYLTWEKYFMPVLPALLLRLVLMSTGHQAGPSSSALT